MRDGSKHNLWFRSLAFALALSLLNFQVSQSLASLNFFQSALYASVPLTETLDGTEEHVPVVPAIDEDADKNYDDEVVGMDQEQDVDFLLDDAPLSEVGEEQSYVVEVYDTASDGIHELQPGMPVAYLANTVTAADLRALRDREEEVGLLIAGDLVVIFSTGDEHFIENIEPVRDLIESPLVSLSAHFHKVGMPSETDLHEGAGLQYVISLTESGEEVVWIQDGATILGAISYEEFITRTIQAREQSDANSTEVREARQRGCPGRGTRTP